MDLLHPSVRSVAGGIVDGGSYLAPLPVSGEKIGYPLDSRLAIGPKTLIGRIKRETVRGKQIFTFITADFRWGIVQGVSSAFLFFHFPLRYRLTGAWVMGFVATYRALTRSSIDSHEAHTPAQQQNKKKNNNRMYTEFRMVSCRRTGGHTGTLKYWLLVFDLIKLTQSSRFRGKERTLSVYVCTGWNQRGNIVLWTIGNKTLTGGVVFSSSVFVVIS